MDFQELLYFIYMAEQEAKLEEEEEEEEDEE